MITPKIYSFPRSGVHFLMATLKRNFYPDTDLSLDGVIGGHWAELVPLPKDDYSALFAGHGADGRVYDFKLECHFTDCPTQTQLAAAIHALADKLVVPQGAVPYPTVYLYRDGRDVAVSLWNAKSLQHPDWRGLSFSEFLRKPLDWQGTPGIRRTARGNDQCVARSWYLHVAGWLSMRTRLDGAPIYVRYEELLLRQEETLDRLAGELKVGPWGWSPVEEKVGIEPHRGVAGGWRDVFSEEDLLYFHSVVPRDFPGLWEEGE